MKEEKHYLGHRERLRKRYLKTGIEGLNEYEILELLLFYSIPVKDTKPIAKELLKNFKNIKNLFLKLDEKKIKSFKGVGEKTFILLKLVKDLYSLIQQQKIFDSKKIDNIDKVIEFMKASAGLTSYECLYILCLNSKNELINYTLMEKGTVNELYLYPRKIVQKALDDNATAIILVHNHPSGIIKPSKNDIIITNKLINILKELGITFHDHIIISSDNYFSFRERGIIQ